MKSVFEFFVKAAAEGGNHLFLKSISNLITGDINNNTKQPSSPGKYVAKVIPCTKLSQR